MFLCLAVCDDTVFLFSLVSSHSPDMQVGRFNESKLPVGMKVILSILLLYWTEIDAAFFTDSACEFCIEYHALVT